MKSEIIIYQTDEQSTRLEVRLEDETVWLTQAQMVELFDSTKQNISLHINNIFREAELSKLSVVKYSLTTAADGKQYRTKLYNLDVIISIGYRVKSLRGTQFRIWANKVLKDYLLKMYAINQQHLKKHNEQYPPIAIETFTKSHDRFLIIDHKTVYHIGASLKDLGKRWFAFSKITFNPDELIARLTNQNKTSFNPL